VETLLDPITPEVTQMEDFPIIMAIVEQEILMLI
jgi:hypothetical protein